MECGKEYGMRIAEYSAESRIKKKQKSSFLFTALFRAPKFFLNGQKNLRPFLGPFDCYNGILMKSLFMG
jgi:hypothetical protein